MVQGDLGFSYRQQQPVLALIAERLPATLLLTGSGTETVYRADDKFDVVQLEHRGGHVDPR